MTNDTKLINEEKVAFAKRVLEARKDLGDELTMAFAFMMFALALVVMGVNTHQMGMLMTSSAYNTPAMVALLSVMVLFIVKIEGAESSTFDKLITAAIAIAPSSLFYDRYEPWAGWVVGILISILAIGLYVQFEQKLYVYISDALVSENTTKWVKVYHMVASSTTLMLGMLIMTDSVVLSVISLGLIPTLPYLGDYIESKVDAYEKANNL